MLHSVVGFTGHRIWSLRRNTSALLLRNYFTTQVNEKIFCDGECIVASYNCMAKSTAKYLFMLNANTTLTIEKLNLPLSQLIGKSSPLVYQPIGSKSKSITIHHATLAEFLQLRHWQKLSCSLKPKVRFVDAIVIIYN